MDLLRLARSFRPDRPSAARCPSTPLVGHLLVRTSASRSGRHHYWIALTNLSIAAGQAFPPDRRRRPCRLATIDRSARLVVDASRRERLSPAPGSAPQG